jgi:NADH:ubiquinone reductase (H+-translocating)
MSNQTNKIIIIGAGYAGLVALQKLAPHKNNEITLIDKNSYHFMQTDVYDLIANEYDFAQVSVDMFTFCSGFEGNVTFKKELVNNVDFKNKKVITQKQRLPYDYLVIAVGARTKFVKSVKGLKEYSYGIKALHRAIYFKQKFELSLFQKVEESGSFCKPLNIVVAGGGLSGVEIAAQMASYANDFYVNNHFLCRKLNIVLVNSPAHILHAMDEKLIEAAEKQLQKLGVKIIINRKVVEVTKSTVTLSEGEVLPTDFMIYAGGIEPNGLVYNLDLEKNAKDYIQTNAFLQTINHENVFAIGDCTTLFHQNKPLAPTADIAEQMGAVCAKNIENLIAKKSLIKHKIKSRGTLIALGRNYAAAKIYGFYFNGLLAYIVKKIVEKIYFKKLDFISKKGCKKIFS